uniref:G-protein coupled receptors family 1 profile domain-containing protein n=1 Tax=Strongyloides venezuelensis TaxID=75913 RepID=A0A0K0FCB7_STRVS
MNEKSFYVFIDINTMVVFLLVQILIITSLISLKLQKKWHSHFRFNLLLTIIIIEFNTILETCVCILNITFGNQLRYTAPYPWNRVFIYCREWQLNMNNFYRYTQWAIIIERLISTIFIDTYENIQLKIYPLIVIFFVTVATYITVMIPKFLNFFSDRHIMYIFIDIPVCIIFYMLYIKSKKLKFNKEYIEKSLSNKFQVNENIFIMWMFFPIITIHIIQQFLLHLFAILVRFMNITMDEYFLIIYSIRIYIFSVTLLAITFIEKLRKHFDKRNLVLQQKNRFAIRGYKINPIFLENNLKTKNNNGNNTKMYFEIFKNEWK